MFTSSEPALDALSSVSTFPSIVVSPPPPPSFIPAQSITVEPKPFSFSHTSLMSTFPGVVSSPPPPFMPAQSVIVKSKPFDFSHNTSLPALEKAHFPIVPSTQPPVLSEQEVDTSTKDSSAMLTLHSQEASYDILTSILNQVVLEMISDVSQVAFTEELQLQKRLKENAIELTSRALLQDLVADAVHDELTDIARENVVFYKKEKLDLVVNTALETILEKSVSVFLTEIAADVYEKENEQYLAKLEMARETTMLSRVRAVFVKWYKASIRKQRMEACRNTFPSCPIIQFTARSPTSCVLSTPVEALAIQNNNARLLESGVLYKRIKEELSWFPLDLTDIFANAFNNEIKFPELSLTAKYWKVLLVYFVNDEVDPGYSLVSQWVCAKFSKGCEKVESFSASKICSLYWLTDLSSHRVAICVRSIAIVSSTFRKNLSQLKKAALLDGTVAILVCFPTASNLSKNCYQQLEQLLKTKSKIPSIPLYSLLIGSDAASCDLASESLGNLQQKKLVSEYKFCTLNLTDDFYELSEKVSSAVDWLVQRCPKVPKFTMKYLNDYFQDGITEVFNLIFQDISHKKNKDYFYQDPEAIISLFNENIRHLCRLICSPSLRTVSGPPPELVEFGEHSLSWRKPEFWQRLKNIMEACTLPEFEGQTLSLIDASEYVQIVFSLTDKNASKLISSMNSLLQKAKPISDTEFLIPWADVIYECVQFLYSSQIESESVEDLCAFYLQEEFENWDLAKRWKEISDSATVLEYSDDDEDIYKVMFGGSSTEDEILNALFKKRRLKAEALKRGYATPETSPPDEKRIKYSESELDISLKAEKEHSDAFSALLQQAMHPFENTDIDKPSEEHEHHMNAFSSDELVPVDDLSSEDHEFSCSGDMRQQVTELEQIIESEKHASKVLDLTLQALLH